MSQKTRFIIYGIVAVILTATYFIKESKTTIRLPVIGKIPAFSFIDSHGDEINRRNLDGKVWVADFIFTTFPGSLAFARERILSSIFCIGPRSRSTSGTI